MNRTEQINQFIAALLGKSSIIEPNLIALVAINSQGSMSGKKQLHLYGDKAATTQSEVIPLIYSAASPFTDCSDAYSAASRPPIPMEVRMSGSATIL